MKIVLILLSLISTLTFGADKELVDKLVKLDNEAHETIDKILEYDSNKIKMVLGHQMWLKLVRMDRKKTAVERMGIDFFYSDNYTNSQAEKDLYYFDGINENLLECLESLGGF